MNNRKLNCIVVDDEPLACKGLVEYIEEARIALEQWSKEYSVGLDMEMLYTPEQGFKKTIVILNIEN